jgi:hypothetical protein
MHIERRPGEQMEVDWAGTTMEITDNLTGEIILAYIFVATLNYSGYAYVEGFLLKSRTVGSPGTSTLTDILAVQPVSSGRTI